MLIKRGGEIIASRLLIIGFFFFFCFHSEGGEFSVRKKGSGQIGEGVEGRELIKEKAVFSLISFSRLRKKKISKIKKKQFFVSIFAKRVSSSNSDKGSELFKFAFRSSGIRLTLSQGIKYTRIYVYIYT